ncbi:hypothetical protein FGO68_gene4355 [Halteria grandinella]|uniref:Uncharacterized protein n=1 Tax=Halteria grandinella TaxID=5974 RepID=A0A8J8P6T5_HALGN|nr:hypothetical protein FGO68_gene4355 [Halteria grandinella]
MSARRQRRQERKLIREQTIMHLANAGSKALIGTDEDDFKNECSLEDDGEGGTSRRKDEDHKLLEDSNVLTPKNVKFGSRYHQSKTHSKFQSNQVSFPNSEIERTRGSKNAEHDFDFKEEKKNDGEAITQFDVPLQDPVSPRKQPRKIDGSQINIIVESATVQQQFKKTVPVINQNYQEDSAIGQGAFGKTVGADKTTQLIQYDEKKFLEIYNGKQNPDETDADRTPTHQEMP